MLKKTMKFISVIMSIAMLVGIFACVSFAKTSEEVDTHLQFNEDGEFKILQIADMQDSYPQKNITKNLIRASIEAEQPDLIVLSGDNINSGAGESALIAPLAINEFMSIFEEYGIPVAAVFGNHDAEGKVSRAQQIEMYEKYDCFIGCSGVDFGDYTSGTYYVPLYSSTDANDMIFNIWMIDSGDYNRENDLGGYAAVTKAQIEWYNETYAALAEANGEAVPSIVFQHIVVPEIFDALEVTDAQSGTISSEINGEMVYYKLPEGSVGVLPEWPCPPDYNNGEFSAFVANGDVQAIFFGHDHLNTYEVEYQGIKLCNTPGVGFASYNGENVGVRTITLYEDDLENFSTEVHTYFDYLDTDADRYLYELYSDTTDVMTKIKAFFLYVFEMLKGFGGFSL
ncbi:MAG: metallophosphoesterase [Clostridia bacterium]|nr:metallophosphoesterase [Clostridia bacterium]